MSSLDVDTISVNVVLLLVLLIKIVRISGVGAGEVQSISQRDHFRERRRANGGGASLSHPLPSSR